MDLPNDVQLLKVVSGFLTPRNEFQDSRQFRIASRLETAWIMSNKVFVPTNLISPETKS